MKIAGYLAACLTVLTMACTPGGTPGEGRHPDMPSPGIVHTDLTCREDPENRYAMYIPAPDTLDGEAVRLPVVLFFDPQADGKLPVNLYKVLADKHRLILIGSNSLRNGMPPEEIDRKVASLYAEAVTTLPSDTNQIWMAGFSGGARIAYLSAFYKVPARGVISCGAGLAGAGGAPEYKPAYYGVAGLADFNMNELVQLGYPLSQAGVTYAIRLFNGRHAWPPADVMDDAFSWLSLRAMEAGHAPRDDAKLAAYLSAMQSKVNRSLRDEDFIGARDLCREARAALGNLVPAGRFNSLSDSIERLPSYSLRREYRTTVMAEEEKERQMLIDAIGSKEAAWWSSRMTGYDRVISAGGSGWRHAEDTLRIRRIQAFLGVLCYMNANAILTSVNHDAALRILSIYEICDPANPEPHYLRAMVMARNNDTLPALRELKSAVKKGFRDKLRLTGQAEFAGMKELPVFYDVMKSIP